MMPEVVHSFPICWTTQPRRCLSHLRGASMRVDFSGATTAPTLPGPALLPGIDRGRFPPRSPPEPPIRLREPVLGVMAIRLDRATLHTKPGRHTSDSQRTSGDHVTAAPRLLLTHPYPPDQGLGHRHHRHPTELGSADATEHRRHHDVHPGGLVPPFVDTTYFTIVGMVRLVGGCGMLPGRG